MAKPIEPTPILKGRDAERFYKSLRDAKNSSQKRGGHMVRPFISGLKPCA